VELGAAEREFHRALDLSPSSAAVHHYYGEHLLRAGYLEEALAEGRIAMELDPISPHSAQFVARALYYLRRYDDAIDELQKALHLHPSSGISHQLLGLVWLARSKTYAEGVSESELARKFMEADPCVTSQVGDAYAVTGKSKESARRSGPTAGGFRRLCAGAPGGACLPRPRRSGAGV
jgi:tetratricopeptide (TPR) repeat protein